MRSLFVALLLTLLAACDSKPAAKKPQPAQAARATVFLYNSTGSSLGLQVSFGEEKPILDLDLENGGSTSLPVNRAMTLRVKVVRPSGMGALDQALEVPPAGQNAGDFLLDFGAAGSFHQWPLFYVPAFSKERWKVPEEIKAKYTVQEISGPKARYDLDFRAESLNRGLKHYRASPGEPDKGQVYLIIVDDAHRRILESGGQLSVNDQ